MKPEEIGTHVFVATTVAGVLVLLVGLLTAIRWLWTEGSCAW